MAFPIENKLVIGVASSALFDLSASDHIYRTQSIEAYRQYQEQQIDVPLPKGVAFPFIRRFLHLNTIFAEHAPVEVVLLSRNSAETGLRVFRSIRHYGLDISRAGFMSGNAPYEYLPAFNASLFLTAHAPDVQKAVKAHYPAGLVLPSETMDDEHDNELRVAFDFDGVIADDESEAIYKKNGDLQEFADYEQRKQTIPHRPGLMADLFKKLNAIQQLEDQLAQGHPDYKKILRTIIITARNAPSHERVITTLKSWGISPGEAFFLGGMEKSRILETLKPHLFFDDQLSHLRSSGKNIPMVHIPFGVANHATEH
jgi:5'-nucleotidase